MKTRWLLAIGLITVILVGGACAEATPTPTPRPTATATPTPTPTATPTPRPGVPTATPTPTPRPTPLPTATPTATPVPKGRLGPGPSVKLDWVAVDNTVLPQYKRIVEPYIAKFAERSGGRVTVTPRTFLELGLSQFDVLRFARQGILEIVFGGMAPIAGDIPVAEGVDLPGLYPSATTADLTAAKKASEAWRLAINAGPLKEKLNVNFLNMFVFVAQVPFCKPQISGLADLKGKKVRLHGTAQGDFLNTLGATPVTLAFPEVYTALERGVVDCAVTGTSSGYATKWYEVTTTLYTLPVTWGIAGNMWNLDYAKSLPADVREFFETNFLEMGIEWSDLNITLTQEGIDCNVGRTCPLGQPAKMIELKPTDADRSRMKEILQTVVLPRWVKRCGAGCADFFNQHLSAILGLTAKE